MSGPEYINIKADEMETLNRLEGVGVIAGGTKGFPNAHLDSLFAAGLCKFLGNNEYMCNGEGRRVASAYRNNPSAFQLIGNVTADLESPPKKAPRRKSKS